MFHSPIVVPSSLHPTPGYGKSYPATGHSCFVSFCIVLNCIVWYCAALFLFALFVDTNFFYRCWLRLLRADLDYQRYSLISQIAVYRSLFHCILLFIPRLKPSSRLLVGSHFPAY
jgi:hypothetical protein